MYVFDIIDINMYAPYFEGKHPTNNLSQNKW